MTVKYKWVAERLELMIEKNIQNGIHKLPSEQELCTKYHVSRQTIRMALGLLEEKASSSESREAARSLQDTPPDRREMSSEFSFPAIRNTSIPA